MRSDENIDAVNDLVLSQDGAPRTHHTTRQIAKETGIHRSTVHRIIHHDLRLKCLKKRRAQELSGANCAARLSRAKTLLRQLLASAVDFIFFSDEKIFTVSGISSKPPERPDICEPDNEETRVLC